MRLEHPCCGGRQELLHILELLVIVILFLCPIRKRSRRRRPVRHCSFSLLVSKAMAAVDDDNNNDGYVDCGGDGDDDGD